jgi:hypothetical protein
MPQKIGYFVKAGRNGFYGAIGPDSTTSTLEEVYSIINKGAIAPRMRRNYVPKKVISMEDVADKWQDVEKLERKGEITVDKKWKQRKGLWPIGEVLKAIDVKEESPQLSDDDTESSSEAEGGGCRKRKPPARKTKDVKKTGKGRKTKRQARKVDKGSTVG